MRLAIISFEARNGKTFKDQTINCIEQLTEYFDDSSSIFKSTVALNFFIPAENNKEYYLQKEEILSCLPPDIKAGNAGPVGRLPFLPSLFSRKRKKKAVKKRPL